MLINNTGFSVFLFYFIVLIQKYGMTVVVKEMEFFESLKALLIPYVAAITTITTTTTATTTTTTTTTTTAAAAATTTTTTNTKSYKS